eukprot:2112288-Rhodomonas_salina.1
MSGTRLTSAALRLGRGDDDAAILLGRLLRHLLQLDRSSPLPGQPLSPTLISNPSNASTNRPRVRFADPQHGAAPRAARVQVRRAHPTACEQQHMLGARGSSVRVSAGPRRAAGCGVLHRVG